MGNQYVWTSANLQNKDVVRQGLGQMLSHTGQDGVGANGELRNKKENQLCSVELNKK